MFAKTVEVLEAARYRGKRCCRVVFVIAKPGGGIDFSACCRIPVSVFMVSSKGTIQLLDVQHLYSRKSDIFSDTIHVNGQNKEFCLVRVEY